MMDSPTGDNHTTGVFEVAAGDILALDAFFFERSGGDQFHLSIKAGADTGHGGTGDGWQLLQNGAEDILLSSTLAPLTAITRVTGTVTVNVTGVNDAPVGVADSAAVTEASDALTNDAGMGNVLTNDTDPDDIAASFTVTEVNGAAGNVGMSVTGTYGSIQINSDGTFTYTLDDSDADTQALMENQIVTEVFNYTLSDNHASGNAKTGSGTITVTVTGANDSPSGTNNTAAVTEDTILNDMGNVLTDDDGSGVDSDVDGAALTVTGINGVTNPATDITGTYGTLNWDTNGSYTYTLTNGTDGTAGPVQNLAAGEMVTDTFTYTVDDNALGLVTGRFIKVENNGPASRRMDIGEIEVFAPGVTLTSNNAGGNAAADFATAANGASLHSKGAVSGFSQPHGSNDDDLIDGAEDSGASVWSSNGVGNFVIIDLGQVREIGKIRVHQRNDSCCQDRLQNFTVSVLDDNAGNPGTAVSTLAFPGQPGTNLFAEFDIPQPDVSKAGTAILTVTVTGVNDAPTVNAAAAGAAVEDTPFSYTHAQMLTFIGAVDIDNPDSDLIVNITNVVNGTLILSGGTGGAGTTFTFTPDMDFNGDLTFNYQIDDQEAADNTSNIGLATIAVSASADTPALSVQPISTSQNSGPVPLIISAAPGSPTETLTVYVTGLPKGTVLSAGSLNSSGQWVLTQADLKDLEVTFPTDFFGDISVTVTAVSADGPVTASASTALKVSIPPYIIPVSSVLSSSGQASVNSDFKFETDKIALMPAAAQKIMRGNSLSFLNKKSSLHFDQEFLSEDALNIIREIFDTNPESKEFKNEGGGLNDVSGIDLETYDISQLTKEEQKFYTSAFDWRGSGRGRRR